MERLRVIEAPNSGKYPYSHSLLIGKTCLIDTGAGEILKELKVDWILNTHWHEDHIAMNWIGEKVMAHYLDAEAIESYKEFEKRYGIGEMAKLFVNFEFCKVNRTFDDGEQFEFEGIPIEVLHTPGHSAGHCCFVVDEKVLFLGDIDLTSFGPWYGCLDCDLRDFVLSIKRLIKEVDRRDVMLAVPSHGNPVYGRENIVEKLKNYMEKIFERDRRINDALKAGKDPVGKGIIYRRIPEPKEVFISFEKIMVEKHLTTSLDEFLQD